MHCLLTEKTRGLIGTRKFSLMRRNAVLINCTRGGIEDEQALLAALTTRRIAGAALDVLVVKLPVAGNPLLDLDLPNLLITPHVAWAGREAMQALGEQFYTMLLSGPPPQPKVQIKANDAYGFFAGLGDLLTTGPTRTNVNDFRATLIT